MATLNRTQARIAIQDLEPFTGSNIYGYDGYGSFGEGYLNEMEKIMFREAQNNDMLYVVYSYNTPIAWYTRDKGWYRVSQKFSVTTSKHMGLVPVTGTMHAYA